jgi:hypothetical protein
MNKYKRIITMPIYLFSIGLIGLYVLKGYFVIRSRKNFKDFLYDYENRKDHILN